METEETVVDTTKTADAELAKLKAENEKFRNEIREIASTRDKLKGDLKAIEDEKLISSGETKKLLEQREKELEEIKGNFDVIKKQADEYESYKKSKREGLLAEIEDEELKTIAEDLSLDKLEIFVKKNKGVKLPDVDNGNAGNKLKLTDAERAEAKRMGLSESDFMDIQISRQKNLKKD